MNQPDYEYWADQAAAKATQEVNSSYPEGRREHSDALKLWFDVFHQEYSARMSPDRFRPRGLEGEAER